MDRKIRTRRSKAIKKIYGKNFFVTAVYISSTGFLCNYEIHRIAAACFETVRKE